MSKFTGMEHRVPIEKENPSIVCNDALCKKCKLCVKACTLDAGVYPLYDLEKNGDHGVCINCGQCIIACPFNALTEVSNISDVEQAIADPNKKVVFITAPAVRVSLGDAFNLPTGTNVESKMVSALRKLGADYVLDVTFGADMTIMEEAFELIERIQNKGVLPMFTSCCPGWVSFCEMFYPDYLNHLSTVKSPIGIQSTLIKTLFAKKNNINPKDLVVVSVTPCTAKKYEAKRVELSQGMKSQGLDGLDCDISITTRELAKMIKDHAIDFNSLEDQEFDNMLGKGSGAGLIFGNTGGVMEAALRTAYYYLNGINAPSDKFLSFEAVRGLDNVKEAYVDMGKLTLHVAVANQMAEAKKLIDEIRNGQKTFDFVEVMACKGGCVNGGGQIKILKKPVMDEARINRNKALYDGDKKMNLRYCHDNPLVKQVYDEFLNKPGSVIAHDLIHTHFYDRSWEINGK
ncbi:MAG: [FeFe] hydrogenase, group A [Acholeplasmatales bacterium]|nr:[FeFe] hydrogenase, group A [Acholeplasmatales bacterium]